MGTEALKRLGLSLAVTIGASDAMAQDSAACAPAPPPILSLSLQSRYEGSDGSRATLNEEAKAKAEANLKPLDGFLSDLANGLGAMLQAPADQKPDLADCLIRQIAQWAQADALSNLETQTAQLTIGSRLAGVALITGQAALYATDMPALALSRDWLTARIKEQMLFWEEAPRGAASGNLRAWAALAAAATAEQTKDETMQAWAIWSTHYVLCSANPDGSLPQEMTREKFALHYQLYALSPLVTSVALFERQGIPMLDQCEGALERAVHFALSDLETGQKSEDITGHVQSFFDGSAQLGDHHLAWLEAYLKLVSDPLADEIAAARRPLSFSKLGGNQTLIWAQ